MGTQWLHESGMTEPPLVLWRAEDLAASEAWVLAMSCIGTKPQNSRVGVAPLLTIVRDQTIPDSWVEWSGTDRSLLQGCHMEGGKWNGQGGASFQLEVLLSCLVLLLPASASASGGLVCTLLFAPGVDKAILEKEYQPLNSRHSVIPLWETPIISLVQGTLLMDYAYSR